MTIPFNPSGIPQALRDLRQWLGHRNKIPHSILDGKKRTGEQGSEHDRARLVDFDAAVTAVEKGRFDGAGITLLPEDGLVCIDLDKCRNPETGELSPFARKVLDLVGPTYVEVSRSGTGLHVFARGRTEVFKTPGLEVYCGKQFIALTGHRLPGAGDEIAPISDESLTRLRKYVDQKKAKTRGGDRKSPQEPTPAHQGSGKSHAERYCLGALDKAVDEVRSAVEGERNDTLNRAAFGLAQLVASGGITDTTIRAALTTAAESIGLPAAEIRITLDSGIRKGLAEPRTIPPPRGSGRGVEMPSASGDDWRRDLMRKDERLIDCRENIYLMLKHHPELVGVVWADEFARKIVKRRCPPWETEAGFVRGTEWGEDDDLRFGLWLAQHESMLVRKIESLAAAVGWCARESRFHPVREYLDGLQWDGTRRVDSWLNRFLGVRSTPYAKLSGKLFLIGSVARIYQPGCIMRSMPILEGQQFRGKSTAARILGGDWFSDTPLDLNHKDSYQLIQGRWFYEVAELDAFSRAESTRIKAFVSSPEDRFRAPYDRAPKDWPRHTVFLGTTNQGEYFKDPTGNSRYWPWRVEEAGTIDLDGLAETRDQLFAEAVALYRSGHRWHPTREEQLLLFEPEQADREIADPWQAMIADWLKGSAKDEVTVTDVLSECLKIEPSKIDSARQMSTRVGIAMKRLGWVKKRRPDGARDYYYQRPLNSAPAEAGQGGAYVPL